MLLAGAYAYNGASAVSVLTDEDFFRGSLHYLTAIRQAAALPILRKDFIIDPYQVYEGRAAGADAILLIVAALDDAQPARFARADAGAGYGGAGRSAQRTRKCNGALRLGATLIGINNRDLKTFHVDLQTTARLAKLVGDDALLVAESGIFNASHVRTMADSGADAILVGESLIRAPDLVCLARELSSVERLCHD